MATVDGMQQAEIYIKIGKLDEAIKICQTTLQQQPHQVYAYKLLGIAMQLKGEFEEAEKYYKKVLFIEPNQAEIYANLGNIYSKINHWEEAILAYQKAIEINPNNTLFYQDLAKILARINQTEAAADCWYQVIIREPEKILPEEQFRLGNTLLEQGKIEQAIICYRYAIQFNPNFYHPYCQLGFALSQKEQFLEAISAYQKAIELNPNFSWSYQGLGENLSKLQRWEEAILAYQKAIELNPNFSWSYQGLGENLSKLQRWEEAISAYQKAIELNPSFSWSYYNLAQALIKLKRWEEAVIALNQLIELNPNQPEFYFNLGEVFLNLNKWEEAVRAYQKSLQLNPDCYWSYYLQGEAFSQLQQWDDAIVAYRQAIELNPQIEKAYQKLGEILQQQGYCNEAMRSFNADSTIAFYKDYIQIYPQCEFYPILGELLIKQEKWEEAILYLIQWLKRHPGYYETYAKLSLILEKLGRHFEGSDCRNLQKLPLDWLKNFLNFSEDLLTQIIAEPSIQKIPVYPETLVNFSPPNWIEGEPDPALFPNSMLSPEAFVAVVPNGRVWGDGLTSAVITSDHQLITDLSTGCCELIVAHDQLPNPLELQGTVAFLSTQFGLIYYHWMVDTIARFDLLQKSGFDISDIDWFVVNHHQHSYEKETLKLLNIPEHKIIDSSVYPHIKAPLLLVPSPLPWNQLKASRWGVNFIKNSFLTQGQNSDSNRRRIYISRKNAYSRKVVNESEFLPFLEQLGFETVCLENLSFQEQVSCLARAEVVIAPHGSGLTNLVFCSPNTKVIEFLFPRWTSSCYWQLCNIINCEYYCLLGESVEEQNSNLNPNMDNIKVNIDSLLKIMQIAGLIEFMNNSNDHKKAEEYLTSANHLVDQGNIEAALPLYYQSIELNPNHYHAHHQLGQALNQLKRYEDAIAAYSQAIALNPNFSWSYNSLGEAFIQLKRWEEAVQAYTQFIQFNPKFCWAYFNLGQALFQLNSWQEAVNAYQKAIELEPLICWFYLSLGDAFMKLKRGQEAIQAYSQVIKLNPNVDWFYEKLAEAFQAENQLESAIVNYQKALDFNPKAWYFVGLGKVFIQQEQLATALNYLIQGLQIQPDYYEAYNCIASIFEQQNQETDAGFCRVHYQLPISLIQKVCNLSDSHFIATNTAPHLVKIPIYPASQIQPTPPKLIEGTLTPSFQLTSLHFPETFVSVVPNGRVWADTLTSAIITSDQQLITDLSTGSAALVVNSPHLPSPRKLQGTVAFLSVKWGQNYYHWMFDILARFDLLLQQFSIQEIDWFVVNRCQSNYERETLQLLNIPSNKIIESCDYPALTADRFLIPSYSHATSRTPGWACNFLKNLCLTSQSFNFSFPLEKIYLSRSSASYRQVKNEAEVISFLQKFGFTAISLESLSVQEQAYCMANAKVIISPHGAGLTNLVFCSPGTQVIEFLLPHWSVSCYWELSNICGCNYYCLLCEPSDPNHSPVDFSQHIKVNLDLLLKLMEWAGIV